VCGERLRPPQSGLVQVPFEEVATITAFRAEVAVFHTSRTACVKIRIDLLRSCDLDFPEGKFLATEFSHRSALKSENSAKL
jgi:hypothetical protein